jgi:hypothetical protein
MNVKSYLYNKNKHVTYNLSSASVNAPRPVVSTLSMLRTKSRQLQNSISTAVLNKRARNHLKSKNLIFEYIQNINVNKLKIKSHLKSSRDGFVWPLSHTIN